MAALYGLIFCVIGLANFSFFSFVKEQHRKTATTKCVVSIKSAYGFLCFCLDSNREIHIHMIAYRRFAKEHCQRRKTLLLLSAITKKPNDRPSDRQTGRLPKLLYIVVYNCINIFRLHESRMKVSFFLIQLMEFCVVSFRLRCPLHLPTYACIHQFFFARANVSDSLDWLSEIAS